MEHTPSTNDAHGHGGEEVAARSSVTSRQSTSDVAPTQSQKSNTAAEGYGRQATSNAYVAAAEEMKRQSTADMQRKATEEKQRYSQIGVTRQATAEMQRQTTQEMKRQATNEIEQQAAEEERHRAQTEMEAKAAEDTRDRGTTEFDHGAHGTEELQSTSHMQASHDPHEEPVFEVFQDPDPASPPPKDKSARGRMSTSDTNPDTPSTTASNVSPRKAPRQQKFVSAPQPVSGHSVLNLSSFQKSPRYTFQPSHREHNIMNTPGPGQYDQDGKLVGKKPQHVMTSRPAAAVAPTRPGPGAYEIKPKIGEGKHSAFGMKREGKKQQTPGPGAYAHKEIVGSGSNFTVNEKREDHNRGRAVPGPGQYDGENTNSTKVRNPQFTMTGPGSRHTAKEQPAKDKMLPPGPGAYEIATRMGEGKKSSHGMPKQYPQSSTPGPGHYGGAYTTFHLPNQN